MKKHHIMNHGEEEAYLGDRWLLIVQWWRLQGCWRGTKVANWAIEKKWCVNANFFALFPT